MAVTSVLDHRTALIYVMVLMSAVDNEMTDAELRAIGETVRVLPIFDGYDLGQISDDGKTCASLLSEDDGLDAALGLIAHALPEKLRETAYVLACDIAAADDSVAPEESELLEMIRRKLTITRLAAAAIERAARARYAQM